MIGKLRASINDNNLLFMFCFFQYGTIVSTSTSPVQRKIQRVAQDRERAKRYFLSLWSISFSLKLKKYINWIFLIYLAIFLCSRATSMERLSSSSSTLSSRSPGHKLCIYVNSGWVIIFVFDKNYALMLLSLCRSSSFLSLPLSMNALFQLPKKNKFIIINPTSCWCITGCFFNWASPEFA